MPFKREKGEPEGKKEKGGEHVRSKSKEDLAVRDKGKPLRRKTDLLPCPSSLRLQRLGDQRLAPPPAERPPHELSTDPLRAATYSLMCDRSFLLSLKIRICYRSSLASLALASLASSVLPPRCPCSAFIVTVALPFSLRLLATSHLVTCSSPFLSR